MFDFLKKNEEPLFTLSVKLEHRAEDALTEKAPIVKIKSDGSVYAAIKRIGNIAPPLWNYILQFGTPKEMRRESPLVFDMDVYGQVDRADICENPIGHPYIYSCGVTDIWPHMIPHAEYYCQIIDHEDHFDVIVSGVKIGEMEDIEEKKRLAKLRNMLSNGYKATAKIAPQDNYCDLFVNIRK